MIKVVVLRSTTSHAPVKRVESFHSFMSFLQDASEQRAVIRTRFDAARHRATRSCSPRRPFDKSWQKKKQRNTLKCLLLWCLSLFLSQIQPREAAAVAPSWVTLHHEGFFRRCVFLVEPSTPALLATFISMLRLTVFPLKYIELCLFCFFKLGVAMTCPHDSRVKRNLLTLCHLLRLFKLQQTRRGLRCVSVVTSSRCQSHSETFLGQFMMLLQVTRK